MYSRRRFSEAQLDKQARTFRLLGLIGVGLFCVALAFWLASDGVRAVARSPSATVRPVDPLHAEFERCNALGYAALEDDACHRAWIEHRRRFFQRNR